MGHVLASLVESMYILKLTSMVLIAHAIIIFHILTEHERRYYN